MINIYKEAQWTSFDVVAKMRGILHIKKIGHAGTLDPAAEGVLPVCIGKATRIADMLSGETKTYRAKMRLGVVTDTLDQTGRVIHRTESSAMQDLSEDKIRSVINSFAGGYDQIPPMYSARHVQGKRLYELAREGKTVNRQPVHVRIDDITVEQIVLEGGFAECGAFSSYPLIELSVTCGRGTYIRSLCADIGEKLGCGAVMTHLVRTRVGPFDIREALRINQVEETPDITKIVIPIDRVFEKLPAAAVEGSFEKLAHNGNKIPAEGLSLYDTAMAPTGKFRLYDAQGAFVGIYCIDESGKMARPVKMFF